jgi:hypothetical protein
MRVGIAVQVVLEGDILQALEEEVRTHPLMFRAS